jgi:hypothetical protein
MDGCQSTYEHDLGIVVLTNDIVPVNNSYIPDFFSYMRLRAANEKYSEYLIQGRKPLIIIAGGQIRKQDPYLCDVLAQTAIKEYGIPPRDVCRESRSIDTVQNAKFALDILAQQGIWDYILVTNEFQMQRALDCFWIYHRRYNLKMPEAFCAEDVLSEKFPQHKHLVDSFKYEQDTLRRYKKNKLSRIITNIPFFGPLASQAIAHLQMLNGGRPRDTIRRQFFM